MFQTEFEQKVKTRILRSIILCYENRAFNEIMWKNTAEPDWPQVTI